MIHRVVVKRPVVGLSVCLAQVVDLLGELHVLVQIARGMQREGAIVAQYAAELRVGRAHLAQQLAEHVHACVRQRLKLEAWLRHDVLIERLARGEHLGGVLDHLLAIRGADLHRLVAQLFATVRAGIEELLAPGQLALDSLADARDLHALVQEPHELVEVWRRGPGFALLQLIDRAAAEDLAREPQARGGLLLVLAVEGRLALHLVRGENRLREALGTRGRTRAGTHLREALGALGRTRAVLANVLVVAHRPSF